MENLEKINAELKAGSGQNIKILLNVRESCF